MRRKLNELINDKFDIPDISKEYNKASMAAQMQELEARSHPVAEMNANGNGPSARSLATFLKKSGSMGGGDSPCYYWGYVLLEKLRTQLTKTASPDSRLRSNECYISFFFFELA